MLLLLACSSVASISNNQALLVGVSHPLVDYQVVDADLAAVPRGGVAAVRNNDHAHGVVEQGVALVGQHVHAKLDPVSHKQLLLQGQLSEGLISHAALDLAL